jgi:hypothetical protein
MLTYGTKGEEARGWMEDRAGREVPIGSACLRADIGHARSLNIIEGTSNNTRFR